MLPLAAARDIGVLNGFSIVRGLLTGADPDAAAARGRWGHQEDVARARAMRQWCPARGVSLLALALQFCLREERIHGNPLGSQNIAELEANVAAVTTPLPELALRRVRGGQALEGTRGCTTRRHPPRAPSC